MGCRTYESPLELCLYESLKLPPCNAQLGRRRLPPSSLWDLYVPSQLLSVSDALVVSTLTPVERVAAGVTQLHFSSTVYNPGPDRLQCTPHTLASIFL